MVALGQAPEESQRKKILIDSEFVGPIRPKKTRRRFVSDEQRVEAGKERDRKKYANRAAEREARAKAGCEQSGVEYKKFARKTKYEKSCALCGLFFFATLDAAKYCSAVCKNRVNNTSEKSEERRKFNLMYKLKSGIRVLVRTSFRRRGFSKGSKTEEILGCSWPEFQMHIERQFLSGMSWENMGKEIHIDHIVPLATAESAKDVFRLNHFTNLRPLWAKDNLSKGAQITHLI